MTRSPLGGQAYWDKWTTFGVKTIEKNAEIIAGPSGNPKYRPQFVFDLSVEYTRLIITCYSRGDPIRDLGQHFPGLLDAWELSNNLAAELNTQLKPGEGWDQRHLGTAAQVSSDPRSHNDPRAWVFSLSNLNHYNWCFWLVGLALALELPDEHWKRLLALVGGEGEDELLDRVIASRDPGRRVGGVLLHKKPYARLLKAIDAPKEQQVAQLKEFVDHWYVELNRKGADELWWYIFGDPVKHPLEKGSYFGRWCIEAVAAVKAFGLDDSQCLGHEHYPGDLLRPVGPSTHVQRQEKKRGWLARLMGR